MGSFSLEIHFPFSRSKSYPEVLKQARLFTDFREKPNVLSISDIDELFGRWDSFSTVIFGATKWAGTNVYFDGRLVIPYKNEFFYLLLDVKQCYKQYKQSTDKLGFCSGSDWGCYRLKQIGRYINVSNYYIRNPFYRYGYFKDNETWIIDKNRIFEIMAEEAKITMADNCPGFDMDRVNRAIAKLSDQIRIGGNWEIEYKLDVDKKGLVGIPTNVNFVPNPEPPTPLTPEEEFINPEEDPDSFLDRMLREREKKRKDDYSDLL